MTLNQLFLKIRRETSCLTMKLLRKAASFAKKLDVKNEFSWFLTQEMSEGHDGQEINRDKGHHVGQKRRFELQGLCLVEGNLKKKRPFKSFLTLYPNEAKKEGN